jgi:catechol 2,3-dioxygenase-like lactoylglutathione lyase family enzyme
MLSGYEFRATIPAADINRARKFYEEKLGLTPVAELPEGSVIYRLKDSTLMLFPLYPPELVGRAGHALGGWEIDDIEMLVHDLKAKGVIFKDYDTELFRTENGIATIGDTRVAWLVDSEENVLGLYQRTSQN